MTAPYWQITDAQAGVDRLKLSELAITCAQHTRVSQYGSVLGSNMLHSRITRQPYLDAIHVETDPHTQSIARAQ